MLVTTNALLVVVTRAQIGKLRVKYKERATKKNRPRAHTLHARRAHSWRVTHHYKVRPIGAPRAWSGLFGLYFQLGWAVWSAGLNEGL